MAVWMRVVWVARGLQAPHCCALRAQCAAWHHQCRMHSSHDGDHTRVRRGDGTYEYDTVSLVVRCVVYTAVRRGTVRPVARAAQSRVASGCNRGPLQRRHATTPHIRTLYTVPSHTPALLYHTPRSYTPLPAVLHLPCPHTHRGTAVCRHHACNTLVSLES